MTVNTLSCGQALVRLLEDYGVEVVFGIPGVHTMELYRGLEKSPIRHVLARHEQGAAFMADGYARATGRPGVCFLITGPGLTNAATAIAEAYGDSQPMLVISSVNPKASLGKGWGDLHEMEDQRASTAPFTAFSATVITPNEVPGLIARAFSVFRSEPPRPVHIEIPIDVFDERVAGAWSTFATPARPVPDPHAVAAAVELLVDAERPAMIVGGGANRAGAALRDVVEKLACPVLTTVAGNGAIPDNHPLNLGPRTSDPGVLELFAQADAVLAIGTEMVVWESGPAGPIRIGGKLVRVDIDPRKLVDRLPAAVALWSDAGSAAAALAAALPDADSKRRAQSAETVTRLRTQADSNLSELQKKHMRIGAILKQTLP